MHHLGGFYDFNEALSVSVFLSPCLCEWSYLQHRRPVDGAQGDKAACNGSGERLEGPRCLQVEQPQRTRRKSHAPASLQK